MLHNQKLTEVVKMFLQIEDPKIMKQFLADILTKAELEDVITRLQILKLLNQGLTQREIAKQLGVSISKVTRGSQLLQKKGNVIDKLL